MDVDKSDKDFATLPRDQQFLELVRRKLRKANKKIQRITALEASLASSKAKVNEEQKQLLASKDTTNLMVKEFSDLQNQMTKLIGEKEVTTPSAPAASTTEEKKERPPRKRKENKEATKEAPSTSESSKQEKNDQGSQGSDTQTESTTQSTESLAPQQQQQEQQHENASQKQETREQKGERQPKPKREWEFQKDIYLAQFKQNFGPEQAGKFIAVSKGQLLGPFDSQEELTKAIGSNGDKKDPSIYLAKIGDEDKNPVRRSGGRRDRDRSGKGGDRSGSGAASGSPQQQREGGARPPRRDGPARGDGSTRGASSNNQRRGGNGGGRGANGSGNNSSPSQSRPQQTQ